MNLLPSATLILLFSGASAVSGSNVRGDVSGKGHQKEQVTRHLLNGQEPGLAEGPEDEGKCCFSRKATANQAYICMPC